LLILEIQFYNKNIGEELEMNNITSMQLHVTDINSGNTKILKKNHIPRKVLWGCQKTHGMVE
jgi:hypothetical protein